MRFLADESCDFAVVRALRGEGFDVLSISETHSGVSDEFVLTLALHEDRIVLTEDKDFGQLAYARTETGSAVILLRFRAGARAAMSRAVVNLVKSSARKLAGRFVVVEPGRVRFSELP